MMAWKRNAFIAAAAATLAITAPAPAYAYVQPIWLGINQSYYLPTTSPITRVAVSSDKVAQVKVLGKFALNIVAVGEGTTTLNVWTRNGMRQEFQISVSQVDDGLAQQIEKAIDLPGVKVQKVGKKILLRGTVANQYEKDLAFNIASIYVEEQNGKEENKVNHTETGGGVSSNTDITDKELTNSNIINMLQMTNPDQINIEAEVIEVNSDDAKRLGITYSGGSLSTSSTTTSAGGVSSTTTSTDVSLESPGNFFGGETYGRLREPGHHWYNKNWLYTHFSQVNANIYALVEQGKARLVSPPNVTTMRGRDARILVGGQIPYPVSAGDGKTSVEYKDYGIVLDLTNPTVDTAGNITSRLHATVSRLDWSNAVTVDGFNMPGLSTRSADTMVNIPSGMTMVIAGLMNSEDSKSIQKVPVLGNIPLLGELFKYHNNSRQKSEIIVLITPHIVNETSSVRMSPKMEQTYNDERREQQGMKEVDVNAPLPELEKKPDAETDTAKAAANAAAEGTDGTWQPVSAEEMMQRAQKAAEESVTAQQPAAATAGR